MFISQAASDFWLLILVWKFPILAQFRKGSGKREKERKIDFSIAQWGDIFYWTNLKAGKDAGQIFRH